MPRKIGCCLILVGLLMLLGCLPNTSSVNLQIQGLTDNLQHERVLSCIAKGQSVFFKTKTFEFNITPFIDDPLFHTRNLYINSSTTRFPDGTFTRLEFMNNNGLFALVAKGARKNYQFLEGFRIRDGKIINEDKSQNKRWTEVIITGPNNKEYIACPGRKVEIVGTKEKWEFNLVGSYKVSEKMVQEGPEFMADFMVVKKI